MIAAAELATVTRVLPRDYLIWVPLLALAFNVALAWQRRWRELWIFQVAGLVNVAVEVAMVLGGVRRFEAAALWERALAVCCLGWVTNGFLFSLAYADVRAWLSGIGRGPGLWLLNGLFVVGLPLASAPWGLFPGEVRTWRLMGETVPALAPLLAAALALALWGLGYRRLLLRLLVVGTLIDVLFEVRLFLLGIRPAAELDVAHVARRALCEMNIALMVGVLLLMALFDLAAYRDDRLAQARRAGEGTP